MKALVIYYSITGNTKKVAQAIHKGMCAAGRSGEKFDIAKLREVRPQDLIGYDLIGLGSPVMYRQELHNVTAFIEDGIRYAEGKHGFAFCTHGHCLAITCPE